MVWDSTCSLKRSLPGIGLRIRRMEFAGLTAVWLLVGNTSGVVKANPTCSTRKPFSDCSTRPEKKRMDIFREYSRSVDDQSKQLMTLRGLFEFATGKRESISIDEVEPISEIVKRFSTGAMSYGSISQEAHETWQSR